MLCRRESEAFDFNFKGICLQTANRIEREGSEWTKSEPQFFHEDILEAYRRRGIIEGKFLKKFGPNLIRDATRLHGRVTVAQQLREIATAS